MSAERPDAVTARGSTADQGHGPVDVLIVGAGPVGLTLANFLGMYGASALVVEGRETLIDYPRGVGMDDECLRTFQAVGLVDEVLPHTTPNQWLRFMTAKGRCYASIEPRLTPFGWPRRNAFIQPLVDQVLLDGISRFSSALVQWDRTAVSMEEDADGITVTVDNHQTGAQERLRARYVVGCDGGRSFVRKSMGVAWEGSSNPTRWLVVDIRNDPVGTPNAYVHGDWRRPWVSIGLPHGIRRLEFMLMPGETDEAMADRRRVDEIVRSVVPGLEEIDYAGYRVYTHHARVAASFVRGRAMIAGDAAHLMPVWQGQGYNSGIRDAGNLAWKLAAVIGGIADPGLLQSYDTERRGHAAAMVRISQTAGLLVRQTTRRSAAVRDAITRAWELVPPLKRYIVEMRYKPMPRFTDGIVVKQDQPGRDSAVGRLFIQPKVVRRSGGSVLLDDVLGPWFSLVAWGDDVRPYLDSSAQAVLQALGCRFVTVRPLTQLHWGEPDKDDHVVVGDGTGDLKAWFDDQEESVVVVRPDRFVALTGRPVDLSGRIEQLGRLMGIRRDGPKVSLADPSTNQLCIQERRTEEEE